MLFQGQGEINIFLLINSKDPWNPLDLKLLTLIEFEPLY